MPTHQFVEIMSASRQQRNDARNPNMALQVICGDTCTGVAICHSSQAAQ
jgi:hypothetical protein